MHQALNRITFIVSLSTAIHPAVRFRYAGRRYCTVMGTPSLIRPSQILGYMRGPWSLRGPDAKADIAKHNVLAFTRLGVFYQREQPAVLFCPTGERIQRILRLPMRRGGSKPNRKALPLI